MEDIKTLKIEKHLLGKRAFPIYNRPSVVGYYSINSCRNYCNDLSQLKYVRIDDRLLSDGETCNVNYNLDKGRDQAVPKIEDDVPLKDLLKWILEKRKNRESFVKPNVVSYRGLLTMLMCTPYEEKEGWVICATKCGGTLFLYEYETDEKKEKRENMSEREKQFTYWGHKFEKYMCSEKPDGRTNPSSPVNENEELCIVFTTELNARRLLFGAEVDGVLNSSREIKNCVELAQSRLVELKTSRQGQPVYSFKRFKLLKWWCQSFLVGIEHLICGFRSDEGIVHKLKQFHVLKIPRLAQNMWHPNVCMNFCDTFLDFADSLVKEETPDTVWRFEWKPGRDVIAIKMEGHSQDTFLPEWFSQNYKSVVP